MQEEDVIGLGPFETEFAARATDAKGNFTSNDLLLLEYLTGRLDSISFYTAKSLAQQVGVSHAGVVRFAHKLGYTGFAELREASRTAMLEAQQSPLSRFARREHGSLAEEKAAQDAKNLLTTVKLVGETLVPAAKALAQARRVFVIGARMSFGLAVQLHRLLNDVRDEVTLIDPGFPDQIVGIDSNDTVVAFLFRRYSRLTADLLADIGEGQANLILITDGRGHVSANRARHVLVASVAGPTLFDSMVAPMWILESLVAEVAAAYPAASRSRLRAVERLTSGHRLLLK